MPIRGVDIPHKPAVWRADDGVVFVDLSGFRHLNSDQVRFIHNARLRVSGRQPHPLLVLAGDLLTVDFDVQLFAARPDLQHWTEAMAIVGNSFMLRHLVSMFTSYHPPRYPVRLFDTEGQALQWLSDGEDDTARNQNADG
jgi:hypothetical protein